MKVFFICLVFAIPSLSFGLICFSCDATTADVTRCAKNQMPVVRMCDFRRPDDRAVVDGIQRHSDLGNIARKRGRHSRDCTCKKGFNEKKFPLDEQVGCWITWKNTENTIAGCKSSLTLVNPALEPMTFACHGSKNSGSCFCSTNFCSTDSMKEIFLKPSNFWQQEFEEIKESLRNMKLHLNILAVLFILLVIFVVALFKQLYQSGTLVNIYSIRPNI